MDNRFKASKNIIGRWKENEVSSELREIIDSWSLFARQNYRDWEKGHRAGHFFGGCFNYEIESSSSALVMAVMAATGRENGQNAISAEEAAGMAEKTIRYLCLTHHTGPPEFTRGKSRNRQISETKWGWRKDNFFMSSQSGVSVSMLGLAAWLIWDRLDEQTRHMVGTVLEYYADEYSGTLPGTGTYNDTQCEENAWTALGIGAALYIFPEHPNRDIWLEGYINWSLNAAVTYKDKLEMEKDKVTGQSRGGFTYQGKTYGISSVTFHPDFTTENHGYVHPDYMNSAIILRSSSAVFPLLAGEKPIESLFFNSTRIYEKTIKPWCAFDGIPISPQGQDWFYHKHQNKLFMHAAMNLFFHDREAALFERKCIDIIKKRQRGTGNGSLMEKNSSKLDVTPGLQSVLDKEHGAIKTLVLSYLLHLMLGKGMVPAKEDSVNKRLAGNHFHPYGGVYIYRTKNSFASFSTRCSVMGLTIPQKGMWDITADFYGLTGIIKKRGNADDYFKNKKINWQDMVTETKREKIIEYKKGFTATVEVERAKGDIRQLISFTALDGGQTVYCEKVKAASKTDIEVYETGRIGVGNENYEYIPELAKGYKDIYFNGTPKRFNSGYEGEDVVFAGRDVSRVNIDDSIGYLVYNSEVTEYRNIHKYPKWKGLEDILIINKKGPVKMDEDEQTSIFTLVSLPGATSAETDKEYLSTKLNYTGENIVSIRMKESRITVNFNDEEENAVEEMFFKEEGLQIYRGRTKINGFNVRCEFKIDGFSTLVEKPSAVLYINPEATLELEVFCSSENGVFIKNNSPKDAHYELDMRSGRKAFDHPGSTVIGPVEIK